MPKQIKPQTSFNAGEISPRLYARVDGKFLSKYEDALKTCTNCLLTPHGPVFRRAGTKYIAEVKDSTETPRLAKYQINRDIAFVLEVGDTYIRFYKDGGQVTDGGAVEVTTPWSDTEAQSIQWAQSVSDLYVTHPSYEPRVITRTNDTTWSIDTLGAFPPPTYEAGFAPSATLTPGATSGTSVTFTASSGVFLKGDVGRQIINNATGETGRASIISYTNTSTVVCDILEDFTDTNPIASGDWKMDLSPIADLTPDGTKVGSIINITADEPDSTTALATFRSADVGRYILIAGGVVQIVSVNSSSSIDCEVLKTLNSKDETGNWSLEDATWDSTRGYPSALTFFEGRLILGGTTAQPSTTWWSEAGLFNGFGIGPDASDALEIDIDGSRQANEITWLAGTRSLIVGTSGAEATLDSSAAGKISPENEPETRVRTFIGSEPQQITEINNEVLFSQRSGTKMQAFRFNLDIDNYDADDLMIFAEHIASAGIKRYAYAAQPDNTLYVVLDDGSMLVGTYLRSQQILGWSKWTTDGSYEDVQVISEGAKDNVYFLVKRNIDGSDVRYIEILETGEGEDNIHCFSDCALTYSDPKTITGITQANPGVVTAASHGYSNGDTVKLISVGGMTEVIGKTYTVANKTTNTYELTDSSGSNIDTTGFTAYTSGGESHKLVTTISGLSHLEGETVQVKADGGTHPDEVVSSGSITLDRPSYEVTVGLPYTTTIETLDKEFQTGIGSGQGQPIRHIRPLLKLLTSSRPLVNGTLAPARAGSDAMDSSVPLFTGTQQYGPFDWNTTGNLTVTSSDPLPMRLLGIFGTLQGEVKY